VVLPELALGVRRQRGLGGEVRLVVERERLLLERDADLALVVVFELLEGRTDPPTEGSLEV
jgi:hypothetical protein